MLKGNLSTRPFYSERLATLVVGAILLVVLILTAVNTMQLLALTSQRRELRARIDQDHAEAASIRAAAASVQQTVDRAALTRLAAATSEANDVIGQRTFSWTAFFGLLERTLPTDARLVMVTPRVERGVFKVTMTIVARDLTDAADFVDALLETGRFYDTAILEQQRREDGAFNAVIEASYLAAPQGASAAPTPTGAGGAP